MRDLFVFLFLFLLGLAVWTTGLFPAAPVQAVPPMEPENEVSGVALERSTADLSPASEEPASPQVDPPALSDAPGDREEASGANLPSQRDIERAGSSDPSDRDLEDGNPLDREQNRQVIQRIMIPSLKIDAQVVDVSFNGVTWDISTLGHDIARLGELPGESAGENVVLAGHFTIGWTELGPFRYISRLAPGEPVLIYTDRMIYTYQVREHAVVGDQDERVIAHTSEPQLTLLTCETWDEKTGKFLRRRVVFADLVRSEPLGHPTIQ